MSNWYRGERVNVAEYYRKIPRKRELVQLSDGTVKWRDEIEELLKANEANGGVLRDADGFPIEEVKSRKGHNLPD